jgi:hypothetical protein
MPAQGNALGIRKGAISAIVSVCHNPLARPQRSQIVAGQLPNQVREVGI